MPDWLKDLNATQQEAVTHGSSPLLIIAGAGTGKTRTLACRMAWLVHNGMDPERILLLTFTRRAAEEMTKRASALLSRQGTVCSAVWGGTFHAMASRLLRLYGRAANIPDDFTLMDASDAEDLLNVIRHELGFDSQNRRFPRKGTCLSIYSRCVNGTDPLDVVLTRSFPWCIDWQNELQDLFHAYVLRKQKRNVFDFDDLLLYWNQCLTDDALARALGGRFDHILVDEYQDTNALQAGLLRGMRRFGGSITVVGDDAQSIYSFRAATVRNILDFPAQFPGTRVITLEQNYRSTPSILESANRVMAQAGERYVKNLWSGRPAGTRPRLVTCRDEADQDRYVVDQVLHFYESGIPLQQQAVLFRAADLSDSLELELTRRNIPYHKYGGLRFLETAHIKDLLAFLRILENPQDEIAWFRVLLLFPGVGPSTAGRLYGSLSATPSPAEALQHVPVPAAARESLAGLLRLFVDLKSPHANAGIDVERIRQLYEPLLRDAYEAPDVRLRDIEHMQQIAGTYPSRRAFLTDLQIDPPVSTSDLAGPPVRDDDWLVLSTIHSAKGCEWDVVFLIHASDGCLPSDMATGNTAEIDEERRLAYVAMTRARNHLCITWPLRYYHKNQRTTDRHTYAQVSRFLTRDVQETMAMEATASGGREEAGVNMKTPLDIASRMRDMWKRG